MAGIALLGVPGLNIGWRMARSQWILGSCDRWEFPWFCEGQWQVLLHMSTDRQMPAVRAVQGNREGVYISFIAWWVEWVYINPLVPGRSGCDFENANFQSCFTEWYLQILICPENAKRPCWWQVAIGSGNGLAPALSHFQLFKLMQIYAAIWRH